MTDKEVMQQALELSLAQPVQPERTPLEDYDLSQSAEYHKGREDGRAKGYEVGYRYATHVKDAEIARLQGLLTLQTTDATHQCLDCFFKYTPAPMQSEDCPRCALIIQRPAAKGLIMKIGGKYNWKDQPDRLIYLGKKGNWHQFKKIGDPRDVWCEALDSDLESFEETFQAHEPLN